MVPNFLSASRHFRRQSLAKPSINPRVKYNAGRKSSPVAWRSSLATTYGCETAQAPRETPFVEREASEARAASRRQARLVKPQTQAADGPNRHAPPLRLARPPATPKAQDNPRPRADEGTPFHTAATPRHCVGNATVFIHLIATRKKKTAQERPQDIFADGAWQTELPLLWKRRLVALIHYRNRI